MFLFQKPERSEVRSDDMRVETACRFVSGAPNVSTGDHMGVAPTVVLGANKRE